MPRPHVYVHRIGPWGSRYLDDANLDRLAEFSDFTDDSLLTEPAANLAEKLKRADAILSLNGTGAEDIGREALEGSTVKVAAIAHWFHGSHDRAVQDWSAAGVEVIDCSDGNNFAVAQWTLGAMITGLFRFAELDRAMRAGELWPEHERTSSFLDGQRIGLVGLGRIGRLVARLLANFHVSVVGYDRYVSAEEAGQFGVEWLPLDEVMRTCDVISFHLPVTPETERMVTREHIESIPRGALVVNSARTAILDYEAFMEGLAAGRFRAIVDVFEPEPPPLDDPIRSLPNVVTTPHVAGSTLTMCRASGRTAVEALRSWFEQRAGG